MMVYRKPPADLAALFEKAEKLYPHYAISPVGNGPDPRVVDTKRHGHFMRLPLGNGFNRWCFETDVYRDRFIIDYKHLGVRNED